MRDERAQGRLVSRDGWPVSGGTLTAVGAGSATTLGVVEPARGGGAVLPAPGTWVIDPVHSGIRALALPGSRP